MAATVVDEHLTSFVSDIGQLITGFFTFLEFILGISYFCGQKLTGWVITASLLLWELLSQTSEILHNIGSELWDFGGGVIRGFLLIYYGIWMIFESFYIITLDLKSFSVHVLVSVGQLLNETQTAVFYHTGRAFTNVPSHISEALIFVGERTIFFVGCVFNIFKDFFTQLILAPLNVLQSVGLLLYKTVNRIYDLGSQMPITAQVGFAVVTIIFTVYWKFSMLALLRRIPYVLRKIFLGISTSLKFLKNSKRIAKEIMKSGEMDGSDSYTTGRTDTKAICVICQDATVCFISMPCKHVCLCYSCVKTLVNMDNRCPLCRSAVTKFERVYIPL